MPCDVAAQRGPSESVLERVLLLGLPGLPRVLLLLLLQPVVSGVVIGVREGGRQTDPVLLDPAPDVLPVQLPCAAHGHGVGGVLRAQVQVVGALGDEDGLHRVAHVPHHAARRPGVQQPVAACRATTSPSGPGQDEPEWAGGAGGAGEFRSVPYSVHCTYGLGPKTGFWVPCVLSFLPSISSHKICIRVEKYKTFRQN